MRPQETNIYIPVHGLKEGWDDPDLRTVALHEGAATEDFVASTLGQLGGFKMGSAPGG